MSEPTVLNNLLATTLFSLTAAAFATTIPAGALPRAGGGLVLFGTSKNKLNVPSETRLTFRLTQDLLPV